MPADALEPPPSQTALQADIAAKTAAAVQETGFGKEFDAEVEAAIARDDESRKPADAGDAKPEPAKAAPKEPAKPAKPAVPDLDIPDALLTKKDKAAAKPDALDPEREKAIKEQTAGMSQKAADRFRAIEAKAHAAEQKAARAEKLEAELNEARERLKSAVDTSVVDALKKEREELDEIVSKQAVAEHPRFKAKYDQQIAKEVSTASKLVSKEAAAEVEALLSLPETTQRNRRLNEIAGELEELERGKFIKAIDNADRLSSERAGELANWKVNKTRLAELSEAEKAQAQEHQKRTVEKAYKNVVARFTDEEKGVELFRKADGNSEWNEAVDKRLESVRKLTEAELSKEEIAEMAAWAIGSQEYRKMFFTQRALLRKLQEEIATLKSGEPDLGAGSGGASDDDEKGGMIDIVARVAQKQGAVR